MNQGKTIETSVTREGGGGEGFGIELLHKEWEMVKKKTEKERSSVLFDSRYGLILESRK